LSPNFERSAERLNIGKGIDALVKETVIAGAKNRKRSLRENKPWSGQNRKKMRGWDVIVFALRGKMRHFSQQRTRRLFMKNFSN